MDPSVSDQASVQAMPPPPNPAPRKRPLSEGSGMLSDGGGAEARKRAHPRPSSSSTKTDLFLASAHRIKLKDLTRVLTLSEDYYVTGSVMGVRQYSEDSQRVTMVINDSSTSTPLRIVLRGPWAEGMPRLTTAAPKLTLSLAGMRWGVTASPIGDEKTYAAIFEHGARLRVQGETFDGFEAARKIEAAQSKPGPSGTSASGQAGPSMPLLTRPPPPPSTTLPPSSEQVHIGFPSDTSTLALIGVKRPRSPSPGHPTSSKRPLASGLPAYGSPPGASVRSDPHVDADIVHFARPSDALPPAVPQPVASSSRGPNPFARSNAPSPVPFLSRSSTVPQPVPSFASAQPVMRDKIVEDVVRLDGSLDRPERRITLHLLVDGLIQLPSTRWSEMLASDEMFAAAVAEVTSTLGLAGQVALVESHDVAGVEQAFGSTGHAFSSTGQGEEQTRVEARPSPREVDRTTADIGPDAPPEIAPPPPDDVPGPSSARETGQAPPPEPPEEDCSAHEGFETLPRPDIRMPAFRYHSVASVRKQVVPRPTAVAGVVARIQGPIKTSKDWYTIVTLRDSSGDIDVKIFPPAKDDQPPEGRLKIGQVFFVRETPLKKYHQKLEIIAGSVDKRSVWAFFDSDSLDSLIVQPNRQLIAKDLVDSARLDPAIRAYASKLLRWCTRLEGSLEVKRGRPTLRVEEITTETTFFDCIVQVIGCEYNHAQQAQDVSVTDWTSNSLLETSPMSYEREPKKPFGQHTLTVSLWNDLAYDDHSSFRAGRFLVLHNLKAREKGDHWEASIFNSDGGRIERLKSADPRLKDLLARREAHVQLATGQAAPPTPPPAQSEPTPKPEADSVPVAAVVPPPPVAREDSSAASTAPAQPNAQSPTLPPLAPRLPESSDFGPESTLPNEAGPSKLPVAQTVDVLPVIASVAAVTPSLKGKEREQPMPLAAPALRQRFDSTSDECMVPGSEDDSLTQGRYYDLDHPNGSSLREIVSSDRAKFRTRARIVDYFPKALEDVVLGTCDRCDVDLPLTDMRCRKCNDVTGEYTVWRYRLVLSLSDGTAHVRAAIFDEDMHALFPSLPPASEYQHFPTNPMVYLADELGKLVPLDAAKPGPLLDLSLRKFRPEEGTSVGGAWSYRVFATVMRGERP